MSEAMDLAQAISVITRELSRLQASPDNDAWFAWGVVMTALTHQGEVKIAAGPPEWSDQTPHT